MHKSRRRVAPTTAKRLARRGRGRSRLQTAYRRFFTPGSPFPSGDPFELVSAFDHSVPVTTAPSTASD